MPAEVTTVADDEAVLFDGADWTRIEGLDPGHEYTVLDQTFRTLPRPGGERLATVATVNDVHFGERECGVIEGMDVGPVLQAEPGERPYTEVMNESAIAEILAIEPDAVVAKGDLTTNGNAAEYQLFLDAYGAAFGDRLHHVRGNHDAYHGEDFASEAPFSVTLPGVTLAVIDTVVPGSSGGQVSAEQLEWLDDLGATADRPVLVFGHHHAWDPGSRTRSATYFGIRPDDSERLIEVVARRRALVGYFAGHTHRNRVRRFAATGDVPFVEVACVKDFPGSWAEYRVFEGGILQVHRRISAPEALDWSERCRALFGGLYPQYAFGQLAVRCFAIDPR
ncbi:MAG: 3,5-cyclic-AMP phosphodiesterase [Acidimicrobiaceae bacterium]|nr:3,5-cyclic-AMP phosphodiesterase [Acidimicrobiaceae bacterium]